MNGRKTISILAAEFRKESATLPLPDYYKLYMQYLERVFKEGYTMLDFAHALRLPPHLPPKQVPLKGTT